MHELQAQTRDRLGEIAALLADLPVAVKQRHTPPPTHPRPETALTRAMARVKREREEAYDAKIEDFVTKAKERYRRQQAEKEATGAVDD